MELKKQMIHMEREFPLTSSQFVLDEDFIIPDSNPDVTSILLDKGEVILEDVRCMEQHALVKGRLIYHILYKSDDGTRLLNRLEGFLPFEEPLYMDGLKSMDNISTFLTLEDLSINIINSRKLNLRGLINISAQKNELYDEEIPTELLEEDTAECHYSTGELLELAVLKKDICRIKEEVELPKHHPNISAILWSEVFPGEIEILPTDEQLSVKCNLQIFVLYRSEGEDASIQSYETSVSYNSQLECNGSNASYIPSILYNVTHCNLEMRPDYDGEMRKLGLDMVLDLNIRLFKESAFSALSDVYDTNYDFYPTKKIASLKKLCLNNNSQYKLTATFPAPEDAPAILQLCHFTGQLQTEEPRFTADGLEVCGALLLQILYVTGLDDNPYHAITHSIPFSHFIEVPGATEASVFDVQSHLEKLSITVNNSNEMELRATLSFKTFVYDNFEAEFLTEIEKREISEETKNSLPGMVIYCVKEGDTLWDIGKKYYVSVASIMQQNDLTTSRIYPGDKLFIIK